MMFCTSVDFFVDTEVLARCAGFRSPLSLLQQSPGLVNMCASDRVRRQPTYERADLYPHLIDLGEFVELKLHDHGADAVSRLHQSQVMETVQCFPHRSPADPKLLRQFRFTQASARRVLEQADPLQNDRLDRIHRVGYALRGRPDNLIHSTTTFSGSP